MMQPEDSPSSKVQLIAKAENYCAYRERCSPEVRHKLQEWSSSPQAIEDTIAHLFQKNFLNDERFILAYVSDKFRLDGWGKFKIKYALKLKNLPEILIDQALQTIDTLAYLKKLKDFVEKKSRLLTEQDPRKRKHKLIHAAIAQGFEKELIYDLFK